MESYIVYMLQGAQGAFYTGITKNLSRRLRQHNGEMKGGAKYTRAHRPYHVVYHERYGTLREALRREVEIKKLTRTEKSHLITIGKNKRADG